MLYLPGGKAEPHETDVEAAVREAYEETGLRLTAADVEPFGVVFRAPPTGRLRGRWSR
ncbi:NUDIX domain-containing protein [Curtobacterium flaccumfaciens]|nr:NUDIX domain-containing protein [Curtobacterium flaccumfaciens]